MANARAMTPKYTRYDRTPCERCGHPRGIHRPDGGCSACSFANGKANDGPCKLVLPWVPTNSYDPNRTVK